MTDLTTSVAFGYPIMEVYYFLNKTWVYGNIAMIPLCLIAFISRLLNREYPKHLWTDHLTRACLTFGWCFYLVQMYVKFQVDGADSICEKAFYIHHIGSILLVPPLVINDYLGWWLNPVGFLHGFCLAFPQVEIINYIYVVAILTFHYKIYQQPYRRLTGYWVCRLSFGCIYIFMILLLLGDCSNYLPFAPAS